MVARARRPAKQPKLFGSYAALEEVDNVLEAEEEEQAQASAAGARQARRGGKGRARGPVAHPVTAAAISNLLAAAPQLVDLLLEEDRIRSITLVCRDIVNLNLAAGGSIMLAPVWEALAQRLRVKAATETEAVAVKVAAAALAAADEGQLGAAAAADQGQPAAVQEAGGSHLLAGGSSDPAPTARERRRARGRGAKRDSMPSPTPLDIVKAAVAADPARTAQIRKSEATWALRLSNKHMAGIEAVKGRWGIKYCNELAVRAAAHSRYGDEAMLNAAKQRAEERAAEAERVRQEHWDEQHRVARELRQLREEELKLRLAEHALPPGLHDARRHPGAQFWRLRDWLNTGAGSLTDILSPLVTVRQQQLAQEHRGSNLDDSLAEEGLSAFKSDWRYRCFVSSGEADGLQALLAVARRHDEEDERELERLLEAGDSGPFLRVLCDQPLVHQVGAHRGGRH